MQKSQIISSYVIHAHRLLYQVLITKLIKYLFVANRNSFANSATFTDRLNVNVVVVPFCRSNHKVCPTESPHGTARDSLHGF